MNGILIQNGMCVCCLSTLPLPLSPTPTSRLMPIVQPGEQLAQKKFFAAFLYRHCSDDLGTPSIIMRDAFYQVQQEYGEIHSTQLTHLPPATLVLIRRLAIFFSCCPRNTNFPTRSIDARQRAETQMPARRAGKVG